MRERQVHGEMGRWTLIFTEIRNTVIAAGEGGVGEIVSSVWNILSLSSPKRVPKWRQKSLVCRFGSPSRRLDWIWESSVCRWQLNHGNK